jgi:hypothetical protein
MIGPEDERPKEGPDVAQDAVTVELCDLERNVCVTLRVVRAAGAPDATVLALLCRGGEEVTAHEGVRLDVVEPLARWNARVEHEGFSLEAELEAASGPLEFDATAGLHRYEQLCSVRGTLRLPGEVIEIGGAGRRAHAWGDPDPARFRSLWAVARDRALTVTAVRPQGASEHADELIAAYLVRPDSEPERLEEARLSTIYDSGGRPRSAGLELYVTGEEYPRRASGEAVCQAAADPLLAACFRWSLDGQPAQGGYQVVTPA